MKKLCERVFLLTVVILVSSLTWSAGVVVEERRIGNTSNQASTAPAYLQKNESVKTVDVSESSTNNSVDLNLTPSRRIVEVTDSITEGETSNTSNKGSAGSAWKNYELMEDLRREVAILRSLIEEANNKIERLEKRQKDIYLDLDSRVNRIGSKKQSVSSNGATFSESVKTVNKDVPAALSIGLSALDQGEYKKKYLKATTALQSGRVVDAKKAFLEILERYPTGEYAPNSHYWLGQIASSDTPPRSQDAVRHYLKVIEQFPNSDKVASSLFKVGKVHYDLEEFDKAKTYFDRLVKDFPSDKASSLADRYLKELMK